MKPIQTKPKQQGFLLMIAIVLIVLVAGVFALALSSLSSTGSVSAVQAQNGSNLQLSLNSGMQAAFAKLQTPTLSDRVSCNALNDQTFSTGNANVTFNTSLYTTFFNPIAPSLTTALSNNDTAISLSWRPSSAPQGIIQIDTEAIQYSQLGGCNGATSTCTLTNVIRGALGTTAQAHPVGAFVSQQQCNVTATNTSSINNTQSTTSAVLGKLEGGFFVTASAPPVAKQWNGTAWTTTTEVSSTNNLNAVFAFSNDDAWAVGSGKPNKWVGTMWQANASVPTNYSNAVYNSVFCITDSYCWAVGNALKTPVANNILFFNGGTAWTDPTYAALTPIGNLKSVICTSISNCWAVGNKTAAQFMLYWNGTQWSQITTSPADPLNKPLTSISCVSNTECYAIGPASSTSTDLVIFNWTLVNGTTWQWTYSPTNIPGFSLNAISCTARPKNTSQRLPICWAVGNYTAAGYYALAALYSDNTWSSYSMMGNKNLNTVSCINAVNNCWAGGARGTLLHWDGIQWLLQNSSGVVSTISGISVVGNTNQPPLFWNNP